MHSHGENKKKQRRKGIKEGKKEEIEKEEESERTNISFTFFLENLTLGSDVAVTSIESAVSIQR